MDLFIELCGDAPAFEAAVAARTAAESKSGSPLQKNGIGASRTGENGNRVQEQLDVQMGNTLISDKQAPAMPPVKDDGEDAQTLLCFSCMCLMNGLSQEPPHTPAHIERNHILILPKGVVCVLCSRESKPEHQACTSRLCSH